ncbi:MAG: DedA family protein [Bacillota bacterium]
MTEIMGFLFSIVEMLATKLGYYGVFLGMVLESACIPLPSELILPFAGYLVYVGKFNFWIATMAATLGNVVGSLIAYWVGAYGGKPFIAKYGKYILISPREFSMAEQWFRKYGEQIIFTSRLLPIVRTFISLPAGVAGMNLPRFLLFTFLGSLPWSMLFIYLGRKLGEHWTDLSPIFHRLDYAVLAIVGFLALIMIRKMRHH